ncbi:hypothetical protein LSTR_LSTR008841 [Laodelphax striatellus]|uniref:G-protein coupled receptors family 1 profile domain-containing protein n=1 Tax=Laodelphax striatellus TaxID=195883 RepID=A0A482WT93_LAOST|nr:hypothetical protein LSTR_LSTR008841 [Laodelphax striatellus]
MRTVTNYFLVNLSVADLMMSVFNCIFNFVSMLENNWHFGQTYCTVNNFVANVTVAASVFTLTGISCDRYLAIIRPLKPRMSKMSAHITIVFIWLTSSTLAFPCLLYSKIIVHRKSGLTACILIWPDGQPMVSTLDYVYNIVLFLLTYIVPMTAMVGCYTAMGRELWGSRAIGVLTQRQADSIKSKRKVVRMFIIIVSIFGICWLPYHSYFLYMHFNRSVQYSSYVQHMYLLFYWLAMSNAMVNPLIYYWMNARFRQYFRTAVCEWKMCRRRMSRLEGIETPSMIRHCNHSYSQSRSGTENEYCERGGKNVHTHMHTHYTSNRLKTGGGGNHQHKSNHMAMHSNNNAHTHSMNQSPFTLQCSAGGQGPQRPIMSSNLHHHWRAKNCTSLYDHRMELRRAQTNSSQV